MLSSYTIIQNREAVGLAKDQVLLTFDDGPNSHNQITERLLDVLAEKGIKVCFCIVGKQAEQSPETVQRIKREGHFIANHTYSHPAMWLQSPTSLREEIARCDEILGQILDEPKYRSAAFRPPGGLLTPAVKEVVLEDNLTLVPISYYAFDTWYGASNYDIVVDRILLHARHQQGGSYVLHDKRYRTLAEKTEKFDIPYSGANRNWIPRAVNQIVEELTHDGMSFIDPKTLLGEAIKI